MPFLPLAIVKEREREGALCWAMKETEKRGRERGNEIRFYVSAH